MKHIKKIFESDKYKQETILDYLESCFVDYIDQDYKFTISNTIVTPYYYTMKVNLGKTRGNFNKIADLGKRLTEISEDFETNMRRVNIEYPNFNYYYNIEQENGYLFIRLRIKAIK
jgi:hypothetical protein